LTISGHSPASPISASGRSANAGQSLPDCSKSTYLTLPRNIYGAHLNVRFLHKLRDEMKFPVFDALKAQIACDVARREGLFPPQRHRGAEVTQRKTSEELNALTEKVIGAAIHVLIANWDRVCLRAPIQNAWQSN
jgi:hypothetical protein